MSEDREWILECFPTEEWGWKVSDGWWSLPYISAIDGYSIARGKDYEEWELVNNRLHLLCKLVLSRDWYFTHRSSNHALVLRRGEDYLYSLQQRSGGGRIRGKPVRSQYRFTWYACNGKTRILIGPLAENEAKAREALIKQLKQSAKKYMSKWYVFGGK